MRNSEWGITIPPAVIRPRRGTGILFRNPHSEVRIPMIRYSFPGKVVLVTGSSRGIGAAVLTKFAEAGATCVLHFWDDPDGANKKDAEALAAKLRGMPGGPAVHVFAADVRDPAAVEALMRQ